MKSYAPKLIEAAAQSLAGRVHTSEEIYAALYQLAIDLAAPARSDMPCTMRRMPFANEVLPRHQRATWARGKTVHDVGDD